MCIPIQYALTYPERRPLPVKRLRLEEVGSLTFEAPDPGRFPALRLAYEVLEEGGTSPAVFNAANEVAVAAFLREETSFQEILGSVERTLDSHRALGASSPAGAEREPPTGASHGRAAAVHSRPAPPTRPDLQAILAADRWARDEAARQLQPHRHARGRQCS
jgi:hypothetical protein